MQPLSTLLPLFVYGTLRQGCSNDIARLVPQSTRLCAARLRGRLYCVGWYPHLIVDATADWVVGELVAVPLDGWPTLDALEDVVTPERPNGEYFKRLRSVESPDGPTEALVYEGNPSVLRTDELIAGGDWAAYAEVRGITRFARGDAS